jgi:hypothetical protein
MQVFKDCADNTETANIDKTKNVRTYQYKPRTRIQTTIHQTERTSSHKGINNEKARTITTLFRYNEMRECEDIHLIQIWIALEDLASYITSFPISYQLQN